MPGGGSIYVCTGWTGSATGSGSRISLLVDGPKTLTAIYAIGDPILTPMPTAGCLVGDVNADGVVNIVDALFVAQYYVGTISIEIWNSCAWDVDRNGYIDIVDALRIAQCYVGLISCAF